MKTFNLSNWIEDRADYCELRVHENREMKLQMLNGNVLLNSYKNTSGVSARVNKKGQWGMASSSDIDEENISAAMQSAKRNAAFLADKTDFQPITFSERPANVKKVITTSKTKLEKKEIIDLFGTIENYITKQHPFVSSRFLMAHQLDMEKQIATNAGALVHTSIPKAGVIVRLSTQKNGTPFEVMDHLGGLGEIEDYISSLPDLYKMIDLLAEQLMQKAKGVYAKVGEHEVVLDSALAGILAHEAMGHPTEGDLVLNGSIAKQMMNVPVASPLISMVDFAHTAFGKTCPVPVYADDEGTLSEDVVIIKDGILTNYMTNKETAAHLGVSITGNARGFAFSDEPLVRMRNTCFLPGKDKLDEMIASIEDGYYLVRTGNGEADVTSEFTFGITLGYEVKNGKIGKAIRDTTISGVAVEMLKTVTMVSNEFTWESAGMCGKKQWMPVGMGGPAIKCRVNIGGR